MTPTARCPGASRRRSRCWTLTVPGWCCPRSITATRRGCMPSRSTRDRLSSSSPPRRMRPSDWRWGRVPPASRRTKAGQLTDHARRLVRPGGHVHPGGPAAGHRRWGGRWAALGTRLAAELYNCQVLRTGVADVPDNETRFAWLGQTGTQPGWPSSSEPLDGPWKTAIVFWDPGADSPGWLVSCLQEFASRQVNLTRIESRPRRHGLGRYMFFLALEGQDTAPPVREALEALVGKVEVLRLLGSCAAA